METHFCCKCQHNVKDLFTAPMSSCTEAHAAVKNYLGAHNHFFY